MADFPAAALGIGLGTLLLGVVIGYVLAKRGRRLKVDWHLTVETDEGVHDLGTLRPDPPPEPEPEDPGG